VCENFHIISLCIYTLLGFTEINLWRRLNHFCNAFIGNLLLKMLSKGFFQSIQPQKQFVLVQAASGGIGLELTRKLLNQTSCPVVALTRRDSEPLHALQKQFSDRLNIQHCDITDESSIESCYKAVSSNFSGMELRLLIGAAGILHKPGKNPEKSIKETDQEWMLENLKINAVGPMILAKHFLPLIKPTDPSILAFISAKTGSISDNRLGGWISYRMSKAALNMGIKTLSLELKTKSQGKTICVGLHPGTVKTNMSVPFQNSVAPDKLFSPEFSADKLIHVLDQLKFGKDASSSNGKIFAYDGSEIPY
jgi:NAD(P)-dependent dehydrogenase (short-subunit alcohol dehydrogenase family)